MRIGVTPSVPEKVPGKGPEKVLSRKRSGRAYKWAFRDGRQEIEINSNAQLLLSDVATLHAVCLAGYGIAQLLELGSESLIESGRLEIIFPDWLDERFPLYALHPSRNYLPPKTRAFLDFVIATVKSPNLDSP